ncbi:MAG: DNA-3-methyladenine glycosylase 2 family protein [Ruminococcaceae bacterium]|nr:DNA-3-methyladenine glycosylase 2 family protein [Oscillospiraceae bacterium]
MNMSVISCTAQQAELLSQRDEKLGKFIKKKGIISRDGFDDVFSGICYNIVNQQISMKACEALWTRLCEQLSEIAPQNCLDAAKLKACGLSQSKANCIAECAKRFTTGELSAQKLRDMTDTEVKTALTTIKGIGEWTAEMTLIFCLGRDDVLSLSDFGIRKGLSLLHDIDIKNIKEMKKFKKLYSPCGTAASLYLWKAAREL